MGSPSDHPEIQQGLRQLREHLDAAGLSAKDLAPGDQAAIFLLIVASGRPDFVDGAVVDAQGVADRLGRPLSRAEGLLLRLALALVDPQADPEGPLEVRELFVSNLDATNSTLAATALALAQETLTLDDVGEGGALADIGADRPRVRRRLDGGEGWETFVVGEDGAARWETRSPATPRPTPSPWTAPGLSPSREGGERWRRIDACGWPSAWHWLPAALPLPALRPNRRRRRTPYHREPNTRQRHRARRIGFRARFHRQRPYAMGRNGSRGPAD